MVIFEKMKKIFSLCCVLFLLTACTTLQKDPLQGKTAIYSWEAQGKIRLQCRRDHLGFYWQFIDSKGTLLNNKKQKIGHFTHEEIFFQNGDRIAIKAQETLQKQTENNLPNVLFIAQSDPKNRIYTDITYMVRKNAKGGLPLTVCAPAQQRQILSIPFSARYILYR